MIKTHVRERGSGKTTEIIIRLKENENLITIIPYFSMKQLYPKELHNRVFTLRQVKENSLRGLRFDKILIDEGFLFSKDELAKLYYYLGREKFDIEVYGTI